MDEVFAENHALSTKQRSTVKPVLLPHRHLKEFQSMDYIQDLLFLDF